MSKERDQQFTQIVALGGVTPLLSCLLTSEIVQLQLLCDAELQARADYYPDTDGGESDDSISVP